MSSAPAKGQPARARGVARRLAQPRPSCADAPRLRGAAHGQVASRLLRDAAHRGGGRGGLRRPARARATGRSSVGRVPRDGLRPLPRAGRRDGGAVSRRVGHGQRGLPRAPGRPGRRTGSSPLLPRALYQPDDAGDPRRQARGGSYLPRSTARSSRPTRPATSTRRGLRSAPTSPPVAGSRSRRSTAPEAFSRRSISSVARTEDARETDSGIEIEPVYGEGEQPGEFRSRAAPTRTCTGGGRGRSASTRASARRRRRTRASATCSSAGRPGSRSPSTCRRSSATTRTTRTPSARSAAPGSRSTRSRTCACCSTGSRSARSRPR